MMWLQLRAPLLPLQVQKAASRTGFNQAEEEYIDGDEVIGLG